MEAALHACRPGGGAATSRDAPVAHVKPWRRQHNRQRQQRMDQQAPPPPPAMMSSPRSQPGRSAWTGTARGDYLFALRLPAAAQQAARVFLVL